MDFKFMQAPPANLQLCCAVLALSPVLLQRTPPCYRHPKPSLCLPLLLLLLLLLCLQAEVQVPEPPADRISQLTDMGFSDALARNALLLHRSNVEAALEWLLEHGDDAGAAEPIPQERLRQVRCQY
jgi:hypothetical protein